MKQNELIEFLQRQVSFLQGKLDEALASVSSLTSANEKLTRTVDELRATIDELRKQIASLEDMLKGKDTELDKEKAARQAVQRLQGSTSEKQVKPQAKPVAAEPQEVKPEKKHSNNGAKKKTHPECEVEIIEVEPGSPDFNPELAKYIGSVDVVRYEMIRMRFIKKIYKVKKYVQDERIFKGMLRPRRCSTRSTHPRSSRGLPSFGISMGCRLRTRSATSSRTASTSTRGWRRNS